MPPPPPPPQGFYVRPGRGADKAKYLVYSHGGSWCNTLDPKVASDATWNCVVRAGTYEGSSAYNPPSGPPRKNMAKGIMDPDCATNPHFCNWSVVYFMYCDGSSFTGDRQLPHVVPAPPPAPSSEGAHGTAVADGASGGGGIANASTSLAAPKYIWSRGFRNLHALWDRLLVPTKCVVGPVLLAAGGCAPPAPCTTLALRVVR